MTAIELILRSGYSAQNVGRNEGIRDVANALAFACRCDEVDYKTSTINGDLHRRWFAVATPTWNPKIQKNLNWII